MKTRHWAALAATFFFALLGGLWRASPARPVEHVSLAPGSTVPAPSAAEASAQFRVSYPGSTQEFGAAHQEATRRLITLKSMVAGQAKEPAAALALYREILNNPHENWAVKRQALQNALALMSTLPEKERDRWIARAPKDLLAQAGKSESELLNEVVNRAR